MDIIVILWFVLGLVLLVGGAELLVRGASALAAAVGISPLVIGLTVVAFGTSAPEMAVTVRSSLAGHSDIAVGNVIGSNIFNILLILGLSALITPLVVSSQLIRREVPIMVAVSLAMLLMALDGMIGRIDGLLLFGGIIVYIILSIRLSRRESASAMREDEAPPRFSPGQLATQALLVVAGLAALIIGTNLLVDSAVRVATALGVSELIIGLTIVACGTSLPEAATSIIAAMRGERDIAVGNVVGSNLFNILAILGLAGIIAPVTVAPAAIWLDIPVMVAVAIACLPIFWTGAAIARWEGALFLGYFIAYMAWLILSATGNSVLPAFRVAMGFFVIPLTIITLVVLAVRWHRIRPRADGHA